MRKQQTDNQPTTPGEYADTSYGYDFLPAPKEKPDESAILNARDRGGPPPVAANMAPYAQGQNFDLGDGFVNVGALLAANPAASGYAQQAQAAGNFGAGQQQLQNGNGFTGFLTGGGYGAGMQGFDSALNQLYGRNQVAPPPSQYGTGGRPPPGQRGSDSEPAPAPQVQPLKPPGQQQPPGPRAPTQGSPPSLLSQQPSAPLSDGDGSAPSGQQQPKRRFGQTLGGF